MKILIRGTSPSEKRYRVRCSTCTSIMEYTIADVVKVHYDQRDGHTHELGNCPVCSTKLFDYNPVPLRPIPIIPTRLHTPPGDYF